MPRAVWCDGGSGAGRRFTQSQTDGRDGAAEQPRRCLGTGPIQRYSKYRQGEPVGVWAESVYGLRSGVHIRFSSNGQRVGSIDRQRILCSDRLQSFAVVRGSLVRRAERGAAIGTREDAELGHVAKQFVVFGAGKSTAFARPDAYAKAKQCQDSGIYASTPGRRE